MRELKFGRKTAHLTEKQVKELISFFNPKDAICKGGGITREYIIKKKCSLCKTDSCGAVDCNLCPIGKAFGEHWCSRILTKVGGRNRWNYSYIDSYEVSWSPQNDKWARAMLERIRKYLKELPRK